jgi:DNA-binding winged helix-turn-helix (wHTH) protein
LDPESIVKVFPPFRLEARNQSLWRGETRIALPPKVFAVLEYLVRHAGQLVSQEELLDAVWPETYVQPEVLRTYILEIRKALQDPAKRPVFIETLPKRGYRFIAPLREEAASAEPPPAADPSAKLVGRAPALGELSSYLRAATQGRRQLVFVTGEPGIGKTSLVDAFQRQATAGSGARVVRGQCVEGFGGKEAYYPVLEALGLLLQGAESAQVVQTLATQAPTWLIQFPSIVKPEQRDKLRQELLGATRERMVREISDALETLTAERPLVLLLEDLQWVDNPTLDLISAVARRRAPAKLMLLATYRPSDVAVSRSPLKQLKQDLLVHRLCHETSLRRLAETDVASYLTAEFPPGPWDGRSADSLTGLIHRHSDGNPLFMVAILERLVQSGLMAQGGAGWTLTAAPGQLRLGIPETLQQMLETQIEQLTAAELRLLRAASVAGRRFSAASAATLLNSDPELVEDTCEHLVVRQQILRQSAADPAEGSSYTEYEFKHVLYREVLYGQLKPAHRRQLHLRLAEQMETRFTGGDPALPSELAFHFEEGLDYARAIRYLIQSATQATRRYAHNDAVQLLRHALDLLQHISAEEAGPLEVDILERISDSLYAQGEMLQSAEVDYRTAELAAQRGLHVAQVHALTRVARALAFLDPAQAIAACNRAAEVSRTLGDPLLEARAGMLAACWRIVTNGWNPRDAAEATERRRQLSSDFRAYYEILDAHVLSIQGDYEDALRAARAGIPKALERDSLVVYLSAHSSMAHALLHLGRWGELLEVLAMAGETAEKNGNAPWLGIFQASRAWLHFQACDFEGARQMAQRLLQTYSEEPAGQIGTTAMITLAFAEIALEAPERAVPLLVKILERPEMPRFFLDWYWRMLARLGLGNAWLANGQVKKAAREADLFLESALSTADPNLQALAWDMKARCVAGKSEPAEQCLDRAFAALAKANVPSAAWRVHATAAQVCAGTGRKDDGGCHREQAAAILMQLAESLPEGHALRAFLEVARRRLALQNSKPVSKR